MMQKDCSKEVPEDDQILETDQKPAKDSKLAALFKALSTSNKPASPVTMKQENRTKRQEDFTFWNTQPVTRTDELVTTNGKILNDPLPDEIRAEPYPLPKDFEWCLVDINNEEEMKSVYSLLSLNYVEDDDAMFRFDYSSEFLKWALQPPNWKMDWHLGVRVVANKKLVGFISGIPINLQIHDHRQELVEINFLCVHKKLRSKRLAPVLIKEITRRVNLHGIFQAVYTAGTFLPKPFATSRYYHRNLNPKKLVETGFSSVGQHMTLARMIKLFKLPHTPQTKGFRTMQPKDVAQVTVLLNRFMSRFKVVPVFDEEDVRHWMLPIEDVIYSYVVEDEITNEVTQFVSFYLLPSTVIGNKHHKSLKAAYMFYYAPTLRADGSVDEDACKALVNDALICAQQMKFDVFNCLDLLGNDVFIGDLKFGKGDGNLHYYLYNYKCVDVDHGDVGLVML